MSKQLVGSFTATGATDFRSDGKCVIMMDFGSGSVDVESRMPKGTWIKAETAITADYVKVWDVPKGVPVRLNCTSYTSEIQYAIIPEGADKYPDYS